LYVRDILPFFFCNYGVKARVFLRFPDGDNKAFPSIRFVSEDMISGSDQNLQKPGAHAYEVLRSIGYTDAEIAALIDKGIVFIKT